MQQHGQGYGQGYGPGYTPPRGDTPKTMGTLSMVLGAVVTATSALNLATDGKIFMFTQVDRSQEAAFERYLAEVHGATVAIGIMMMIMSIALFAIGIGQRGHRRWAVPASIGWGIVALLVLVVNVILQFTVVLPALDRFIEEITHGRGPAGAIGGAAKVGAFFGLVVYVPYPLILISTFRKPEVVAAMNQPPRPDAATVFD